MAHEFKEALQEVWSNEALGNPSFHRQIACARGLRTNPYVMGQTKQVSERVHRALVLFDFPLRIKEFSARWPHNAQASKLPSLKQILPRKRTVAEVSVEW